MLEFNITIFVKVFPWGHCRVWLSDTALTVWFYKNVTNNTYTGSSDLWLRLPVGRHAERYNLHACILKVTANMGVPARLISSQRGWEMFVKTAGGPQHIDKESAPRRIYFNAFLFNFIIKCAISWCVAYVFLLSWSLMAQRRMAMWHMFILLLNVLFSDVLLMCFYYRGHRWHSAAWQCEIWDHNKYLIWNILAVGSQSVKHGRFIFFTVSYPCLFLC